MGIEICRCVADLRRSPGGATTMVGERPAWRGAGAGDLAGSVIGTV
jgi:hypothetical protein